MPKVSVIIPVYGVEQYIERCARSLFEQKLDDIEYLFIDDCTQDHSIDILNEILTQYPQRMVQTRIVKMPSNSGQAAVRRHGIQLCTGDYIIHCDSDDWVDTNMLSLMYEKAVDENSDLVVCDYYRSDGFKHQMIKYLSAETYSHVSTYFSMLLSGKASTAVWNKLVRRSIYVENKIIYPQCNMWEDYVLNIQVAYYANKVSYVEEPLYYYYQNRNSICHSNIESKMNQIKVNSQLILNFISQKELDGKYQEELISFKYYARSELAMFVSKKEYRNMWKNIYPEVDSQFCKLRSVSVKEKIKYVSLFWGIYPYIVSCAKIFRNLK